MNTNKPLSEWTLGEIKQRCDSCCAIPEDCVGCPARRANGACAVGEPFEYWDLSEPPRWTEQDKEDAKALRRLIPDAYILCRYSANTFLKLYDRDDNFIMNLNDCFPGLPLGKKITLYEIIGGTNE